MASNKQRQQNLNDVNSAWSQLQVFNSSTLPSKAGSIQNLAYTVGGKRGW